MSPGNTFYGECSLFDGAEVNERALEINGFTRENIMPGKKQSPEELAKAFFKWTQTISNITLAGENVAFDQAFLKNGFHKAKLPWIYGYRLVDLHSLHYLYTLAENSIPLKDNVSSLSLQKTLQFVGLPREPDPHHALTGAKLEAEAFSRIILKKNLLQEFAQHPIPAYLR